MQPAHNRGCVGFVLLRERCQCADVKAAPTILVPALENNARIVLVLADQSYRGAIAMRLQQAYGVLELTENWDKGLLLNRGAGWSSARSRGWRTPIACAATTSCRNITRASSM